MADVRITEDAFPAQALLPDSRGVDPVRVMVADDVLYIYAARGAGVEAIFTSPVLSEEGAFNSGGLLYLTEAGRVVVGKSGGCGCGSPLRSFIPFEGDRLLRVGR